MATDEQTTVNLAMGRFFGMMQRPTRDGDVAEYERCRSLILNLIDGSNFVDNSPNYARDRLRGAAGD